MYSGKIAVPPGGGGLTLNIKNFVYRNHFVTIRKNLVENILGNAIRNTK
jgi:hypothetical protein